MTNMAYQPAETAVRVTESQKQRLKAITDDYGKRTLHEGLEVLLSLAEARQKARNTRKKREAK